MDLIEERLVACFGVVFPGLGAAQVRSARADSVPTWDSIAHISLLTVIGEEFGIDVDFEQFEGATSFPTLLERLRARLSGA